MPEVRPTHRPQPPTPPASGVPPDPAAMTRLYGESEPKTAAVLSRLTVVSGPRRPLGRLPLVLAAAGLVVALVAAGFVVFRGGAQDPGRTPEETVREFLAAVFYARSPQRVAAVVCAGWDPADAINRTTEEVARNVHVSWDEFRVVTTEGERIVMRVRLGLRLPDDLRPTMFTQWRFHLVKEDGWRVCEARPFTP